MFTDEVLEVNYHSNWKLQHFIGASVPSFHQTKYKSRLGHPTLSYFQSFLWLMGSSVWVLWHNSLTNLNRQALERIQKSAVKIILKNKFTEYKDGLKYLSLDELDERRNKFCLKFAKNCIRNQKLNNFFPLNTNTEKVLRKTNKYKINFAKTDRYKNSTIPSLQRIINDHEISRNQLLRVNGV